MSEIIGVKQLYKKLGTIANRTRKGESFVVMKHTTPLFRVVPYEEDTGRNPYTLEDLMQLQFRSGEKNLSKKIDKIVYGK